MRFTGEQLFMGRLVVVDAGCCRVELEGRELVVQVPEYAPALYSLEPGERVCVSVRRGHEPVLTGYLD